MSPVPELQLRLLISPPWIGFHEETLPQGTRPFLLSSLGPPCNGVPPLFAVFSLIPRRAFDCPVQFSPPLKRARLRCDFPKTYWCRILIFPPPRFVPNPIWLREPLDPDIPPRGGAKHLSL